MDLIGFYYEDNSTNSSKPPRIRANGVPISENLKNQGYVQKDDHTGTPAYYVLRCNVYVYYKIGGRKSKVDIYYKILELYPNRQIMSLKLANEVWKRMLAGELILDFAEDGEVLLYEKPKPTRGRAKKS